MLLKHGKKQSKKQSRNTEEKLSVISISTRSDQATLAWKDQTSSKYIQHQDDKPQSVTSSIFPSPKSGLKGYGCYLQLEIILESRIVLH